MRARPSNQVMQDNAAIARTATDREVASEQRTTSGTGIVNPSKIDLPVEADHYVAAPSAAAVVGAANSGSSEQAAVDSNAKVLGFWELLAAEREPKVSTNDDDPFVRPSHLESLALSDFDLDASGKPKGLVGPQVRVEEEDTIYKPEDNGQFVAFATNPYTPARPNADGDFDFSKEPRFPTLGMKAGPDGKPAQDADGRVIFEPLDVHIGQTTAFEALNTARHTVEGWAGRTLAWGEDGQIAINPHAFVGFNAFFNPGDKNLYGGLVPYRLPNDKSIHLFEMTSSWEVIAHEGGHALHHELKPNIVRVPKEENGFNTWGESFGDQVAMWTSLTDINRVRDLLAQTKGDLAKSNPLTAVGEVLAALSGKGTGIRDAFQDKKISNTKPEVHERSEVLTGAAYKVFLGIFDQLQSDPEMQRKHGARLPLWAMTEAGRIMGTFLVRAADYTPETQVSLEDVGKACLSVDREYFGGKYHDLWASELGRREIFSAGSEAAWEKHVASLPALRIDPSMASRADVDAFVQAHLGELGMASGFGLRVSDAQKDADGRLIAHVQMTQNAGWGARPVHNSGLLVFRADGTLAEFQSPMPKGLRADEAMRLLGQAQAMGLRGSASSDAVSLVRSADGSFTAQTVEPVPGRFERKLVVRTLEHPEGVTVGEATHRPDGFERDRVARLLPEGAEVLVA